MHQTDSGIIVAKPRRLAALFFIHLRKEQYSISIFSQMIIPIVLLDANL